MVKKTDYAENTIQRGTVSILEDSASGNGNGDLEVVGNIYGDIIRSNTDVLPVDVEEIEFKEKTMTMTENSTVITEPDTGKHIFYIKNGLLKSTNTLGTLTTYQPTTTKGDLLIHDGITQTRLPVSSDGYTLVADSSTPSGIRWSPFANSNPKSNSKFTLIGKDSDNSCIIVDNVSGVHFNLISVENQEGPICMNLATKNKDASYGHNINLIRTPSLQSGKNLRGDYSPFKEVRIYKESQEGDGDYSKIGNFSFVKTNFSLSGTTWTQIVPDLFGAIFISVGSDTEDFPQGTFVITKSNQNDITANIVRLSSSPSTDLTELSFRWQANSGLEIKKSNAFCDGTYYYTDNFETATSTTISVTGTSTTMLPREFFNTYEKKSVAIRITSGISGYPVTIAFCSKNSHVQNGIFFNVFSPGSTTLEKIIPVWLANTRIGIKKDNTGYNGNYIIDLLF